MILINNGDMIRIKELAGSQLHLLWTCYIPECQSQEPRQGPKSGWYNKIPNIINVIQSQWCSNWSMKSNQWNQLTSDPPRVANKMIKTTWKIPKSHVVLFSCWIVPHDSVEGSSFFCFSFSIDARSSQSRTRSTWESWLWLLFSLFVILTFNNLVFSVEKAIDNDRQ